MAETRRKLTTIMSADVQDYTRLMGADEEGTLATLKRHRDSMSGVIGLHGGRVVNTWGDGLIAEFPSVVEAVRAAIDIQNELAQANSGKPEDGRMMFRIGINLGDVIEQDDDLYGDGVNIAARLQSQAPAGGIVISNTVYDHVRNKLSVGFDFLGELSVKNVHDAIPSYSVRVGEAAMAQQRQPQTAYRAEPPRDPVSPAPPLPGAPPPPRPPEPPRIRPDGLFGYRNRVLKGLAIPAAIVLLVNIFTWHGEFWAAWPLLVLGTIAAFTWSRGQSGFVQRYGPAIIVSVMLIIINILSGSDTAWAKWPILAIAIAVGIRWAAGRSKAN
jgi:class 3 adenylate cyclase